MQRAGRTQARFAFLLAFLVFIPAVARVPASATARLSSPSNADSWTEARVASAVQQGKPLFVYFTADWCLSCKVNETTSIDRAEVRDTFRQAGVTVLVGDWTNGDPAITRFLESRGRAGVPLYLWYSPGKPPEELPQVLTPAMLISRAQALPKH
jgi:thiol:disulfide interchange protein